MFVCLACMYACVCVCVWWGCMCSFPRVYWTQIDILILNYFQITPINMWQDLCCFSLHFLTGSHCRAQTVLEFLGNFLCQPSAAIRSGNHYAAVSLMSTSEYFRFCHALSRDTLVIIFSNSHVSLLIIIAFPFVYFYFMNVLLTFQKCVNHSDLFNVWWK